MFRPLVLRNGGQHVPLSNSRRANGKSEHCTDKSAPVSISARSTAVTECEPDRRPAVEHPGNPSGRCIVVQIGRQAEKVTAHAHNAETADSKKGAMLEPGSSPLGPVGALKPILVSQEFRFSTSTAMIRLSEPSEICSSTSHDPAECWHFRRAVQRHILAMVNVDTRRCRPLP